jgi:cysteine-rich secretory family protein
MSIRARRLLPLLIGLALILPAVVPAPVAASASDAEAMVLKKMNYERTKRGLVALRLDTRLAAIARDRSQYQSRTGDADHTQGSRDVFDFIQGANIKWYAAGEIIAQNRYYPSVDDSAAAAVRGWLGSPTHRSILLSKGYNYVGFGYAMNPDNQRRYWTGVFMKGPDRTAPWAEVGSISKQNDGRFIEVTLRWDGGDRRLQVLTSGFRYYQIQRRRVGGNWLAFPTTTSERKVVHWYPGPDVELRVRSRDRAGNWSKWDYARINL